MNGMLNRGEGILPRPVRERGGVRVLKCALGLLTLLAGCTASGDFLGMSKAGPTRADARRAFPMNDVSKQRTRLSEEQSRWINSLYGDLITRPSELVVYYEARKWRSFYHKGYLFLIKPATSSGESGERGLEVLVGVAQGKVYDLSAVEPSGEKAPYQQLLGCSLEACFGFIRDANGFLEGPPKDEPATTIVTAPPEVADAVKQALILDEVLAWNERGPSR